MANFVNEIKTEKKKKPKILKQAGKRAVMVMGQMGVGKSTVINALAGQNEAAVSDASKSCTKYVTAKERKHCVN